MIIEKTMSDGWLSNTYLVGDKPGGHAVLIDTGARAPLTDRNLQPPARVTKALLQD